MKDLNKYIDEETFSQIDIEVSKCLAKLNIIKDKLDKIYDTDEINTLRKEYREANNTTNTLKLKLEEIDAKNMDLIKDLKIAKYNFNISKQKLQLAKIRELEEY